MADDEQDIMDMLREEIEHFGWSATARKCGMSRGTLHHIFAPGSTISPKLSTIAKITRGLGMRIWVQRQ